MIRILVYILLVLVPWFRTEAQAVQASRSHGAPQGTSPPTAQKPTFVYKLHTSRQKDAMSYLARTPDGGVLAFVPQSEGRWSLIRVTGLESAAPHEESMTIIGVTPADGQEDPGGADVNVAPDGHYAVVRTENWKIVRTFVRTDVRSTVAVVDLRSWKVVSTRRTTDPLYAGSFWAFSKTGVLIATSRSQSTGTLADANQTHSEVHNAASLLLPDLQPSVTCSYTEVIGPAVRSGSSSHRDRAITDLSDSCPELVKLADASSVKDIHHPDDAMYRVAQQLRFNPPDFASPPHTNTFNGCEIHNLGTGERFALYVCTRAHQTWYDTEKYTAVSLSVVSVSDRKEVLRVPRPVKRQTAILVSISGRDYLVILEDGVNLIVYRL